MRQRNAVESYVQMTKDDGSGYGHEGVYRALVWVDVIVGFLSRVMI